MQLITTRLNLVRKKMQIISASKTNQSLARKRSGDVTPRSVRSHTSN
jgi:hypothetical protein